MKKSTILAVLVFAGLLALAVTSLNRKPERGITRISFASVDTATIDRVEIQGPKPVTLMQKDGAWTLDNGKSADADAVKRLLDAIPTIDSSTLITSDSNRFAELEVDEAKGVQVKALAGGKAVAEFIVGKNSGGDGSVRVGNAVYAVKGASAYLFSRDKSAWYQLKQFSGSVDDLERVEVALQGAAPYTLIKKESDWELSNPEVLPAGFRFDKAAARTLASSLFNTRATSVLDTDPGEAVTGLSQGADLLRFSGKNDLKGELRLGAASGTKTHARVDGKSDVVLLADYAVKNLRKQVTDLRELTLIQLDKDKVKSLVLVDGKSLLEFEKQGADWRIKKSSEKIPADFELDPMAVDRRLGALTNARALRVASDVDRAKAGIPGSKASITAVLDDKSQVRLVFGGELKDESRDVVYGVGNIDDAVYLLTSYVRSNLLGGLDSFKRRPEPAGGGGGMPNLSPEALNSLPPEVRAGLMKQLQQKQQEQQMMQALQAQAAQARPATPPPEKKPAN
ncbi:MAG: DUF4340 domain-containing protein [Pseudomonadota bacterium]